MSEVHKLLSAIQKDLNAPKSQYNSFGKYNYRNCEDILKALKPFLKDAAIILNDEMVAIGDRFYVKATATLSILAEGKQETISVTAFAREAESRKGMNADQLTGATSSYARKYALNGLFAIDDSKDSDSMDNTQQSANKTANYGRPTKPTASFGMKDIEGFLALDQPARDKKWPTLSPALQNAINKAAS